VSQTNANVGTGVNNRFRYGRDGLVTGAPVDALRGSHTIAVRFRNTTVATVGTDTFIVGLTKTVANAPMTGSVISVFANNSSVSGLRFDGAVADEPFPRMSAYASTAVWSHVAMTYDGTTLRTYLNGVLVGTGASTSTSVGTTAAGDVQLWAGGTHRAVFCDAVFYSRALAASELLDLANIRRPQNLAGCFGWYPEFGDTVVTDHSGNGNALSIIGTSGVSPDASFETPPTPMGKPAATLLRPTYKPSRPLISGPIVESSAFAGTLSQSQALTTAAAEVSALTASLVQAQALTVTDASVTAFTATLANVVQLSMTTAEVTAFTGGLIQAQSLALAAAEVTAFTAAATQLQALTATLAELSAFTASVSQAQPLSAVVAETTAFAATLKQAQALTASLAETTAFTGVISVVGLNALTMALSEVTAFASVLVQLQALTASLTEATAFAATLNNSFPLSAALFELTSFTASLTQAQALSMSFTETTAFTGALSTGSAGGGGSQSYFATDRRINLGVLHNRRHLRRG
jgi:hypothetical protein